MSGHWSKSLIPHLQSIIPTSPPIGGFAGQAKIVCFNLRNLDERDFCLLFETSKLPLLFVLSALETMSYQVYRHILYIFNTLYFMLYVLHFMLKNVFYKPHNQLNGEKQNETIHKELNTDFPDFHFYRFGVWTGHFTKWCF